MPLLGWISDDGLKILAARAVRSFAYGMLAVLLGVYLKEQGLTSFEIGAIFSLAIAGGALSTLVASTLADRVGRRTYLVAAGVLMAAAGLAFALADGFAFLAVAAVIGTVSPTATEVGPFLSIEQAMLPQTTGVERRTAAFAVYNLGGNVAAALGALAGGLPALLEASTALDRGEALRAMFLIYAVLGVVATILFARLSGEVEVSEERRPLTGLRRSRGRVAGLSALFALDSFGGGFVIQSVVALWFFEKFDVPLERLGTIFFVSGLLSGASFLVAARLAGRFGLLNTMVFTHLPSNVLLMLVPLAPSLPLALAAYLSRMALSQMDVPTRQAYTVALVEPEERTAAAATTNLSRTVAHAVSPSLGGLAMGSLSLSAPFLLGGGLKIVYDLALFAAFRRVRLAEEAPPADLERRQPYEVGDPRAG